MEDQNLEVIERERLPSVSAALLLVQVHIKKLSLSHSVCVRFSATQCTCKACNIRPKSLCLGQGVYLFTNRASLSLESGNICGQMKIHRQMSPSVTTVFLQSVCCPTGLQIIPAQVSGSGDIHFLGIRFARLQKSVSFSRCLHVWLNTAVLHHAAVMKCAMSVRKLHLTLDSSRKWSSSFLVRQCLSENYTWSWILLGHEAPVFRSAGSPDLDFLDVNFLWGYLFVHMSMPIQSVLERNDGVQINIWSQEYTRNLRTLSSSHSWVVCPWIWKQFERLLWECKTKKFINSFFVYFLLLHNPWIFGSI
jgi:hypothetical protein